jgi:uncharacterized protein (TIGR02145 family)
MAYTPGDRLKFTGISGIYSTVKTDIPATDKIIDFEFISCTDGDNNNYPVVKIGTQIWMAANLKTTSYNEGSAIQYTSDETEWKGLTTPGYCWYGNNEAANKDIYGALYNWFTVNAAVNGNKNACPVGWSVPDENDWTTLTTFLGGENTAGGRLKETGLSHWLSPNTGATDEYGFAALPGGLRGYLGAYNDTGTGGLWWSSIQYDATNAWNRQITNTMSDFSYYSYEKQYGFSVRCLQD